jgi:hypothetical protein
MPLQHLDEWQIATCVGALEYVVEVSYGLMGVYQQDELEFGHRRPHRSATE